MDNLVVYYKFKKTRRVNLKIYFEKCLPKSALASHVSVLGPSMKKNVLQLVSTSKVNRWRYELQRKFVKVTNIKSIKQVN